MLTRKGAIGVVAFGLLAFGAGCDRRAIQTRPLSFMSSPDMGYVLASGRWVAAGDSSARSTLVSPLNSVEVECSVERGTCIEARANFDRTSDTFDFLFASAAEYAITSLADSVIVARALIGVYDTELRLDLRSRTAQRSARWSDAAPAGMGGPQFVMWILQ